MASHGRLQNPFVPQFGTYPRVLAGRAGLVDEFEDALDGLSGSFVPSFLLSGQRGMGKTVLLDAYRRIAEGSDWVVISESSSSGLLDRLVRDHLPRALAQHSDKPQATLEEASLNVLGTGAQARWADRFPADSSLRSLVVELTDVLGARGAGLVLMIDEIQAADGEELRKLGEVVQHCYREQRPLALIAAGLSSPVRDLLDQSGTTFLRRAEHLHVGKIAASDVRDALAQTVTEAGRHIEGEAMDIAVRAIDGYPYMLQLVGHRMWKQRPEAETISAGDAMRGVEESVRRLGGNVHSPALRQLSVVDRTYLLAMARDDGPSLTTEVAARMKVTPQYANVYRSRLLDDGIIEAPARGQVTFTLPYLREYLRDHASHDALEGTGGDSAPF
jgi:hypothetical protein